MTDAKMEAFLIRERGARFTTTELPLSEFEAMRQRIRLAERLSEAIEQFKGGA